jgi:hypothetical protein
MHMRAEATGFSEDASGVIDYRHSRGRLKMHLSAAGKAAFEIRVVGHCEYLNASDPSIGAKKPWVSVDLRALPGFGFGSTDANGPAFALQVLSHVGTFRRSGLERVRGVLTTRYRGTIEQRKIEAGLPKSMRDKLKSEGATFGPASAWIDRSGYLRKMILRVASRSTQLATMLVEYYDFGVHVSVVAPPLGEVQDITGKIKNRL